MVADWCSDGEWHIEALDRILPPRIIVKIHAIPPIIRDNTADYWCWDETPTSKFSISSAVSLISDVNNFSHAGF